MELTRKTDMKKARTLASLGIIFLRHPRPCAEDLLILQFSERLEYPRHEAEDDDRVCDVFR